jgi:hypothetical protein
MPLIIVWEAAVSVMGETLLPKVPAPAPEYALVFNMRFKPFGIIPEICAETLRVCPGVTAEEKLIHLVLFEAVLVTILPASVGAVKLKLMLLVFGSTSRSATLGSEKLTPTEEVCPKVSLSIKKNIIGNKNLIS